MGTAPSADVSTSGPAAVLHSLRRGTPPFVPLSKICQQILKVGPRPAASPPRSKRSRSLPASPDSSPVPPAKRRVTPLSPDGDDNRGSKSSADGGGSSPVDLTQDDGYLADDDRGMPGARDADSDAGSGS
ncbi:hypothetical protein PF003_g13695 [Phytophthora fragariae]|nr:hypothetical protein PF003_g13695 [Phytophthora fragariae]